jgi:hypothetical protein
MWVSLILAAYPQLTREDILASIAYGAEMSRGRFVDLPGQSAAAATWHLPKKCARQRRSLRRTTQFRLSRFPPQKNYAVQAVPVSPIPATDSGQQPVVGIVGVLRTTRDTPQRLTARSERITSDGEISIMTQG